MYSNIGKKIKGLAIVLGCLLLVAGVIAFVLLVGNYRHRITAFCCLGGGILSFFMSWFAYGFGQLVEDTRAIRENTAKK